METFVFVTGGPRVYAGAPLGNSADGGYQLDSIALNEITIPAKEVSVGIAPAGTDAAEVDFDIDLTREVTNQLFSDQLDVSSLPEGDYELWARACLGQECGASSVPVVLGDPSTGPDPATSLVFSALSAVSGQYSDEVVIEVHISDALGAAIEGAEVSFELVGAEGDITFSGVTDQAGAASKRVTLSEPPGSYVLRARFGGIADRYDPSADQVSFVVEKEDSNLELLDEGRGSKQTLVAHLSDLDSPNVGLRGRVVTFFADGQEIGTALSDPDGTASFGVPPRYRGGRHDFEAVFNGDELYRQSRGAISSS